jgi:uncharacterized membrane protein (DUF485 family)
MDGGDSGEKKRELVLAFVFILAVIVLIAGIRAFAIHLLIPPFIIGLVIGGLLAVGVILVWWIMTQIQLQKIKKNQDLYQERESRLKAAGTLHKTATPSLRKLTHERNTIRKYEIELIQESPFYTEALQLLAEIGRHFQVKIK